MGIFSKKEYKGRLIWEHIKNENGPQRSQRAKITGGWLFCVQQELGSGVTFIPDPEHKWNGSSK
jgi:hypothetical protein